MKEQAGQIIDFAAENIPVRGCTISKQIYHENGIGISVFSMAEHKDETIRLTKGMSILTPLHKSVGVRAVRDTVYLEIEFRKESIMNELLKSGEVFKLAELLPYQEGKIVNMDIVNEEKMKFVVMSFDEGTGLSEHAAPGEALVFALDGEAVIGYEGKDYVIKAGETFKFDKLGKHSVTATKKFKMALLLVLG